MATRPARPAGPLLWRLGAVGVAAALLYLAATVPPDPAAPRPDGAAAPHAGAATAPGNEARASAAFAQTAYPAIAEHPLFYPSRTPWTPPPPPPPPPAAPVRSPLTDYVLVGVIVSGQSRSALIRPPGTAKIIRLAEGQDLAGWKLEQITRNQLHFTAGGSTYDMTFPRPSAARR